MNDLITVYILNHNYSAYLDECIESLISQTYKNIEIIIIDDNSSDESVKIINRWKKKYDYINTYFNKTSLGLIKSANQALHLSTGNFIIRLDADDFLEKTAIEDLIRDFNTSYKKDKNTVGVFGNYNEIDIDSNLIRKIHKVKIKHSSNELDFPIHGACTLILKDWLLEIGGYDKKYTRQDGYFLWAAASAMKKTFVLSEKVIFNYRQHKKSLSSDRRRILMERSKISDGIIKKFKLESFITSIVMVKGEDLKNSNYELFYKDTIQPITNIDYISEIIVVCSDSSFLDFVKDKNMNIKTIRRDLSFESVNSDLRETLKNLLKKQILDIKKSKIIVIRTFSKNAIKNHILKQLILYLSIFKNKDTAIMARKIEGTIYKDLSTSLQSFGLGEKNHYERDILYERMNGGFAINADKLNDFLKYKPVRVGLVETE